MSRDLIDSKTAAGMLDVSERRVQQLAKEMALPRLGRQFKITQKDVTKMAARDKTLGRKRRSKK